MHRRCVLLKISEDRCAHSLRCAKIEWVEQVCSSAASSSHSVAPNDSRAHSAEQYAVHAEVPLQIIHRFLL